MILVLAAILGLIFGSFLNALVFRTHADIPMTGRSKCAKCEVPIDARDLVPVLSFFLLRGRCRSCKEAISWQYPLVEVITAGLFVILAAQAPSGYVNYDMTAVVFGPIFRNMILTTFLIIIFVYDFQYSYILDRFIFPAMIVAVLLNAALQPFASSFIPTPASMISGAVLLGGFFLAQFLISKGLWIGGGDVRMGVLMGLILGWKLGLLALFLSYVIGAAVGIVLLVSKKKSMTSRIPFGTFLAMGTFISMVWGTHIVDWYLGYFV